MTDGGKESWSRLELGLGQEAITIQTLAGSKAKQALPRPTGAHQQGKAPCLKIM